MESVLYGIYVRTKCWRTRNLTSSLLSLVISDTPVNNSCGNIRPHSHEVFYTNFVFTTNSIRHMLPLLTSKLVPKGRDPFDQNLRKYRSKTQSIGSVQPDKVRKN